MKKKWPRVSGGKKIDEWDVHTDTDPVPVRVYLVRHRDAYSRDTSFAAIALIGGEFQHYASNRYSDPPESIADFEDRVREDVRSRASVTWEPYLMLRVRGSSFVKDPSRSLFFGSKQWVEDVRLTLDIEITSVQLGKTADGEKRHRGGFHLRHSVVRDGWPDTGIDDDGDVVSIVPDTEENRAALTKLQQSMSSLRGWLGFHLSPENVEHSLAKASSLLLGEHNQTMEDE